MPFTRDVPDLLPNRALFMSAGGMHACRTKQRNKQFVGRAVLGRGSGQSAASVTELRDRISSSLKPACALSCSGAFGGGTGSQS